MPREHRDLDLDVVRELLESHWYEMRMVAVSILDARARRFPSADPERTALYDIYLEGHQHIDAWDLVDRAAPRLSPVTAPPTLSSPQLVELPRSGATRVPDRGGRISAASAQTGVGEVGYGGRESVVGCEIHAGRDNLVNAIKDLVAEGDIVRRELALEVG